MNWPDEIDSLYEDLLAQLPLPVRGAVEQSARQAAEEEALEQGRRIDAELALRAFWSATPTELRPNLARTLAVHGLDTPEL